MGDLVIATPFLQAASEKYALTLLAKPYALDLQQRFWPRVNVVPFIAPWTAFQHKYRLWGWPWRQMFSLLEQLAGERFDFGLSARWDPRDHLLLTLVRARARLGFPRVGSQIFLSQPLARPDPTAHRFENWRVMAKALGFELPPREKIGQELRREEGGVSSIGSQAARHSTLDTFDVLVHTGAGQPVRVWPLDRYRNLVAHLRQKGFRVQVACDPEQRPWWLDAGESTVAMPHTVTELFALVDRAGVFLGNDSGPGHLAAFCGVPTFTIFGPQLPEWFAPLHPASEWLEGKPCPYKPCSDYCRFLVPGCMNNSREEEVWGRVASFLERALRRG